MTPIEILATIFAVLVLFKLLLSIISPQSRLKMAESITSKNPAILTIILLALTAIVGYYIFNSYSIVDVAALMLFLSGLIALVFVPYQKLMIKLLREELKSRTIFLSKNWLSILIWAIIAIWVFYTVFIK